MIAMETRAKSHTADTDTQPAQVSAVIDIRLIPLGLLTTSDGNALRRIVPSEDATRVAVAAFSASL